MLIFHAEKNSAKHKTFLSLSYLISQAIGTGYTMRVIWVSHSKELQATNLQTGKQRYRHITKSNHNIK